MRRQGQIIQRLGEYLDMEDTPDSAIETESTREHPVFSYQKADAALKGLIEFTTATLGAIAFANNHSDPRFAASFEVTATTLLRNIAVASKHLASRRYEDTHTALIQAFDHLETVKTSY